MKVCGVIPLGKLPTVGILDFNYIQIIHTGLAANGHLVANIYDDVRLIYKQLCLPQHGGMDSPLIVQSPLMGPSRYPTDLLTGQPSADKGRTQGYQLYLPSSANVRG